MVSAKPKILIVDDDSDMLNLHKLRLGDAYETLTSVDPEGALGLALEHKPAAILLDLLMPHLSGYELCHTLHSLSYTSRIPIFVISGQSAAKYKQHCEELGATGYFEKPVDYGELKRRLSEAIQLGRPERRAHVRVAMRVALKLRGVDSSGKKFEVSTVTENVSPAGFLCGCSAMLNKGDIVEVFLGAAQERFAGRARAVRSEARGTPWQRYGFQFIETTSEWVLNAS
jgi:DNA-binding response OmpR family regulator